MKNKLAAYVAFFLLFDLSEAQSSEDNGINLRNAGRFSCEETIPVLNSQGHQLEKTAFLQWTAGFTTGASMANSLIDVFPLSDTWELVRMTALVCLEDMTLSYSTALRTSIGRLQPYWIRNSLQTVKLSDPNGRIVELYDEAVIPLQNKLISLGANLKSDGVFGSKTGNAIRTVNLNRGAKGWLTPDGELLYILTK